MAAMWKERDVIVLGLTLLEKAMGTRSNDFSEQIRIARIVKAQMEETALLAAVLDAQERDAEDRRKAARS